MKTSKTQAQKLMQSDAITSPTFSNLDESTNPSGLPYFMTVKSQKKIEGGILKTCCARD